MRILHTSDWHLGASFEQHSREEEQRVFLDWLIDATIAEQVDVLIVAGDVFDRQAPSAEAQRLYYRFLAALARTPLRQAVIIGGNHDAAARLDAPRELLGAIRVHVVGGLDDHNPGSRCLCPVTDDRGRLTAFVAAVPFVHEYRLGVRLVGVEDAVIRAELLARFAQLYEGLASEATRLDPGIPLIGVGHLACRGASPSRGESDIHLAGSLGGLPPEIFGPRYAYVALGHFHRGYPVDEAGRVRYSGTPVPLDVDEARSQREVLVVDVDAGAAPIVRRLSVPLTRRLVEVCGTIDEVRDALATLTWDEPLPPLVVVSCAVASPDATLVDELRSLLGRPAGSPILARLRQTLLRPADGRAPPTLVRPLAELDVEEVFRRLCHARGETCDDELLRAFRRLVAEAEVAP